MIIGINVKEEYYIFVLSFFALIILISFNIYLEFLIIKKTEKRNDKIIQTLIISAIMITQITSIFAYVLTDQFIYELIFGLSILIGYGLFILSIWGNINKDIFEKAGITEEDREKIKNSYKNITQSKKIYLKIISKEFMMIKLEMDKKERKIQSLNGGNEKQREKFKLYVEELAVLKERFNKKLEEMKKFSEDLLNEEV